MTRSGGSDAGFSLVEAIVALAIVALCLSAFYKMLAMSFGAQRRINEVEVTLALARSQLDALTMQSATVPGIASGRYGNGVTWRVSISELPGLSMENARTTGPYWIVLEAFDRGRRPMLRLETAKVTRAE